MLRGGSWSKKNETATIELFLKPIIETNDRLTIFFLGAKWLTVSDGNIRKTITVLQAVNHQSW